MAAVAPLLHKYVKGPVPELTVTEAVPLLMQPARPPYAVRFILAVESTTALAVAVQPPDAVTVTT